MNTPGTWDPEVPMLIQFNLIGVDDEDLLAEFEDIFIEKWGGFEVPISGISGDICGGPDSGVLYRTL